MDLNATQAAMRAGYSKKTASRIGPELLGKPCISEAILKAMAERQKRTEITQDMVIDELGKIALADAADYSESALRYSNKLKALELLGKHLGMFETRAGLHAKSENNLIEAIKSADEIDTDDLPEVE